MQRLRWVLRPAHMNRNDGRMTWSEHLHRLTRLSIYFTQIIRERRRQRVSSAALFWHFLLFIRFPECFSLTALHSVPAIVSASDWMSGGRTMQRDASCFLSSLHRSSASSLPLPLPRISLWPWPSSLDQRGTNTARKSLRLQKKCQWRQWKRLYSFCIHVQTEVGIEPAQIFDLVDLKKTILPFFFSLIVRRFVAFLNLV